jgi:small subunit ribosomal protein S4
MARYNGPKAKIARRLGESIFGPLKAVQKKNYPPGMHGRGRRKKQSEYAIQLMEKQKAKYTYGVLEKQFHNLFDEAARRDGITGENLLKLLESRLDNTVFRLGIGKTRRQARQLVSHRHITVNGSLVNIPSYEMKPGDVVAVRSTSQGVPFLADNVSVNRASQFSWLEWNSAELSGKFLNAPDRSEIPEIINEQLIVELYSK